MGRSGPRRLSVSVRFSQLSAQTTLCEGSGRWLGPHSVCIWGERECKWRTERYFRIICFARARFWRSLALGWSASLPEEALAQKEGGGLEPRTAPAFRGGGGKRAGPRREEGERREEEFSSSAFARSQRSPLVSSVSSRPLEARSRAERPRAMGSPALRPALLLPPLLLLLLLRVPPSRGFPGRAGGGAASPAGHRGPFPRDEGRCRGRLCLRRTRLSPPQGGGDAEQGSYLGTGRGEPTGSPPPGAFAAPRARVPSASEVPGDQ